jgi:hypothetical protein
VVDDMTPTARTGQDCFPAISKIKRFERHGSTPRNQKLRTTRFGASNLVSRLKANLTSALLADGILSCTRRSGRTNLIHQSFNRSGMLGKNQSDKFGIE